MTRFEKIRQMDVTELSNWLDKNCTYDSGEYDWWFDRKYCQNCEPVIGRYEDSNRDMEFGYCEFCENCRYFPEKRDIPSRKDIIKMWLEEDED